MNLFNKLQIQSIRSTPASTKLINYNLTNRLNQLQSQRLSSTEANFTRSISSQQIVPVRSKPKFKFKPKPNPITRFTPIHEPEQQYQHEEQEQPEKKRYSRPRRKKLTPEQEEEKRLQEQEELRIHLTQTFQPPQILFENEKVVVIDKPAGCALQADPGSEAHIRWNIIINYLEKRYGQLFIVHRLDKAVTGPLILAKSATAARTLSDQFKNSTVKKTYVAVIQFRPDRTGPIQDAKSSGKIECRIRNRNDRMVIAEAKRTGTGCKETSTDWELVTATGDHAIVKLNPTTGRKHQLRLHCARFLAGPIVGDFKYNFRYLNDQSQKAIQGFLNRESEGRILLHCSEIQFKLYRKEKPREYTVRVQSQIHDDFRIVCDQLDLCAKAVQ